ncbi:C-C motif chemokine 19-like [Clarias gariepinus]|uniref:C-C motif chemokine 19a.1 n=1 Tax=Clarias gariepinus TaxID=13013 RepID=UPI00234CA2DB|nr:C-C motif chemokine 19a.1 [Clarias gariepinus]
MARIGFINLCMCVWITAFIMSVNMDVCFGDQALDCCLKVSHHRIPKRIVACYREQRRTEGCLIDAVVFRTQKGRDLCAPPEVKWVIDLKTAVDNNQMKKHKDNIICQGKKA